MRKILIISILTILSITYAKASDGKWITPAFSLEWGYKASLYHFYHFNYISFDGSRVDNKGSEFDYYSCGCIILGAGVNMGKCFNLSLNGSYAGIYSNRRIFPLTARCTYFTKGHHANGMKLFADAGIMFAETFQNKLPYIAKLGGGYRCMLNRFVSIDLMLSLEYAADYPDKITYKYADGNFDVFSDTNNSSFELRRSALSHLLPCFTMSVNF